MIYIPADCLSDASCQRLENALNLMMLVFSFGTDVQVHAGGIAQRFEKMEEHFCRHVSDTFPFEGGIPYQPGASPEVECYLAQTVVHRKAEAVTLNTPLVAKCPVQTFPECQGRIFDGVVLVHLQVALDTNFQVDRRRVWQSVPACG